MYDAAMKYDPKRYWEDRALSWTAGDYPTREQYRKVRDLLDPQWTVLELGCGTGRWSEYFPAGYEGWDVSGTLVRYCEETWDGCDFKERAVEGSIGTDKDLVFTWTCMLHVTPETIRGVSFDPGQRLMFVEPHVESRVRHCFTHDYASLFGMEEIKKLGKHTVWGRNL